jgi:Protein of unknown function (DUF3667)
MPSEPALTNAATATKHCRNCGADTFGEFCAVCGQETRVKLPTARVFLREAMGRYVALDGRLWRTLAALLFRPGFLTREYFQGRRRRYIRPARLFLVLSLALFAAIRLFVSAPQLVEEELGTKTPAQAASKPMVKFDEGDKGGDIVNLPGFALHVDRDLNLQLNGAEVPWSRELKRRFEHFNQLDRQEKSEQIYFGFVRYGPYAMFVLMPAFAMLMMIAYLGGGKRYPDRPRRYAEHLVFAAHMHAFVFLVSVLAMAIQVGAARMALGFWCLCYALWATKKVYRGGWFGLALRSVFLGLSYSVLFGLVVAGLVVVAILVR